MMLFAFIGIWPATLAVGVGAIAIPVVIHLINRKRFKIVPWAAMKFLLAAQKQTRKRMRIEQLVLLLVRMAILAAVLLAMASVMPYAEAVWSALGLTKIGPSSNERKHRVHHIFVLDASLSMNQSVDNLSAFETARQLALRKIADNPSGDGYSVLILKDSPTWLVGEASQDARKVAREIEAVKPSHGNSSLPAALNMISAKINETKARFPIAQAVYFFTDMQESTWMGAVPSETKAEADSKDKNPYLEIQKKAATIFVDCGPPSSGNLAVTNMEFDLSLRPYVTAGMELTLLATVKNFGTELKKDVRAELLIGKAKENPNDASLQLRVNGQKTETIQARSQQTYRFDQVKFPTPGTYAVQVKISDDPLVQDNARTIIITVRDTIPVLLVNGKASADRFERATEYLRLALNPFPAGTEPQGFPLRPKVVGPSQFTEMTDADLEQYDCIYWCDVPQFGVNDVRKLDAHLRRGGGFIVTLGDKAAANLDDYNRLLYKEGHGLLPAKLMKKIEAPADHHFYFQNTDSNAFSLPPLAAFSEDLDQLTLRTARFRQYVQAVVQEGKARTVLSFMSEVENTEKVKRDPTLPTSGPAIVEWNPPLSKAQQPAPTKGGLRVDRQPARYRGKVILLTSSVNMDWASWPGSPSYGAMMHELTKLAVSGRLREQSQTVGGLLEAYLPGGAEVNVTVKYPAEMNDMKPVKVTTQLIDEVNLFRWPASDYAGVYLVETSTGHEIPFAVNVPANAADQKGSESDLTRTDDTKLKDSYPGWNFQIVRDPLLAMLNGGGQEDPVSVDVAMPVGPGIANGVILFLLGLLFLEIVLAWHFGHYTTTEGAVTNAPAGTTSILIAVVFALIAIGLFSVGATVVIHEKWTGDFLGFVPEIVRTYFELANGLTPPPAGEGRNWHVEPLPFLFGLPGPELWYSVLISLGALVMIFFVYKAEAPKVSLVYKLLLGTLRIVLILTTVWLLLPRLELHYKRLGYPDLVILIDDSRSMGESDTFQDGPVIERVKKLSESIRAQLEQDLPAKIAALQAELEVKNAAAQNDPDLKGEADSVSQRLSYWQRQSDNLATNKWRPSRLQLVQAILAQPEPDWFKAILTRNKTKIHIFHLDINGRATKLHDGDGEASEIVDFRDIPKVAKALPRLEPKGNDSRLGTAVRQVIDHYRGSGLSSVVMFTDGVTTRDETLAQVADYAGQKGISLFFIGVGDENEARDLLLHDLQVEDTIYIGDKAVFEARITGHGYKDLTVPVILKLRDPKTGKEKEVAREMVKVDPAGKSVKIRLRDQPKKVGAHPYIIEVKPPKLEANEKPIAPGNLRLERTIEVIDTKLIKVLYVEGQPRYEFRYVKFLLEREAPDEKQKKKKSIELKVLLLDADEEFAAQDNTALSHFPPTLEQLNQYDVLILGDCDPNHKKLKNHLKDIVAYVRGEDEKGRKAAKSGGGLLFIAGSFNNPHRYKGTLLADVLPVEPSQDQPPAELPRVDVMRPDLTSMGRAHPIFRFSPDEGENQSIWGNLTPMYWFSTKYKVKNAAEVLAVHKTLTAEAKDREGNTKHPLVVQQYVGSGRSMFFGFDETWRWRLKEHEPKYNNFWIQTMRYLSRGRSTRTNLSLDRQTPYRLGEKIKIRVTFPDSVPGGANPLGPKLNEKTDVKVTVEYTPPDAKEKGEQQKITIPLVKADGSWGTYEGTWDQMREGKYRFRLTHPDVSATQPDGEKPSAEAIVEMPPGELDKVRMNHQEMKQAAEATLGEFYTLASADQVLEKLPPGYPVEIASPHAPTLLWNHWLVFVVVLFLITSEWVLRKMKHLL